MKELPQAMVGPVSIPSWLVIGAFVRAGSRLKLCSTDARFGRCKKCGARLIKTGHPRDFTQHYKCPDRGG